MQSSCTGCRKYVESCLFGSQLALYRLYSADWLITVQLIDWANSLFLHFDKGKYDKTVKKENIQFIVLKQADE